MVRRYVITLGAVILLLFVPLAVVQPLRNAAVNTIKPIGRFLTERNSGIRNAWLNLTNIGSVREDRNRLQEQVVNLQKQVIDTENIQRENDALRKELGVTGVTRDLPKAFAQIILRGDNPLDYTFTIDAGRAHGVRVGQPAVAQGSLVGRVVEVREQTSVIRAITSLNSRVQAWLTMNQEKGFLIGTGNGVELEDISQGLEVPMGSIVETSGLGGGIPPGVLIGEIESLQSAKSDLSQTFRVHVPVDPLSIQSLFIVLTDQP